MLKSYKAVLFIRFLGYFFIIGGFLMFIFMLGPLITAEIGYRLDQARGIKRVVASSIETSKNIESSNQSFADIQPQENVILPISTDYGIVIEKINANAKIIPNVNAAKESEYSKALSEGVAEALGSTKPGEAGNLYLFSHSTDAPWNIVRYNAIFFLLRELNLGDRVVIFYKNQRFDYIVFDKVIASPKDVSFLTNRYDVPVLTLQTCDPPGTLLNRLIVRARLAGG